MSLIIFLLVGLIFPWYAWGQHEAEFNRIKNIARRNSPDYRGEISNADANSKRWMVVMQFLLLGLLSGAVAVYMSNLLYLPSLLIYGFAAKWFFGELFYGKAMTGDYLHIGIGGQLDDELMLSPWQYFIARMSLWLLSLTLVILVPYVFDIWTWIESLGSFIVSIFA